eukprot:1321415-Amorphochlora_amoeboformis.AAC.1
MEGGRNKDESMILQPKKNIRMREKREGLRQQRLRCPVDVPEYGRRVILKMNLDIDINKGNMI